MLNSKDTHLLAALLTAPATHRATGASTGLKAAEIRALLAIAVLCGEYTGYVEVRELAAARLAAPTRLRAAVAVLVQTGYVRRKRRYQRHCLLLTDTGSRLVAECLRATRRAAKDFGRS